MTILVGVLTVALLLRLEWRVIRFMRLLGEARARADDAWTAETLAWIESMRRHENMLEHFQRTGHTVSAGFTEPWHCHQCPVRSPEYELAVDQILCAFDVTAEEIGVAQHRELA